MDKVLAGGEEPEQRLDPLPVDQPNAYPGSALLRLSMASKPLVHGNTTTRRPSRQLGCQLLIMLEVLRGSCRAPLAGLSLKTAFTFLPE